MREIIELLTPLVPVAALVPWAVAFLLWRAWEQEREACRVERLQLSAAIVTEREQRVVVLREALTTMAQQTAAVERLSETISRLADRGMLGAGR